MESTTNLTAYRTDKAGGQSEHIAEDTMTPMKGNELHGSRGQGIPLIEILKGQGNKLIPAQGHIDRHIAEVGLAEFENRLYPQNTQTISIDFATH